MKQAPFLLEPQPRELLEAGQGIKVGDRCGLVAPPLADSAGVGVYEVFDVLAP